MFDFTLIFAIMYQSVIKQKLNFQLSKLISEFYLCLLQESFPKSFPARNNVILLLPLVEFTSIEKSSKY